VEIAGQAYEVEKLQQGQSPQQVMMPGGTPAAVLDIIP
jgi:hypothetical protein